MEFDLDEQGHVSATPLMDFRIGTILETTTILKLSFFQKEAERVGSVQLSLTAYQCRYLAQQLRDQADILERTR